MAAKPVFYKTAQKIIRSEVRGGRNYKPPIRNIQLPGAQGSELLTFCLRVACDALEMRFSERPPEPQEAPCVRRDIRGLRGTETLQQQQKNKERKKGRSKLERKSGGLGVGFLGCCASKTRLSRSIDVGTFRLEHGMSPMSRLIYRSSVLCPQVPLPFGRHSCSPTNCSYRKFPAR